VFAFLYAFLGIALAVKYLDFSSILFNLCQFLNALLLLWAGLKYVKDIN
jgi:hypothetical protein